MRVRPLTVLFVPSLIAVLAACPTEGPRCGEGERCAKPDGGPVDEGEDGGPVDEGGEDGGPGHEGEDGGPGNGGEDGGPGHEGEDGGPSGEGPGDGGLVDGGLVDGGPPTGSLGGACYGNLTCDTPWTCDDGRCVDWLAALPRGAALWAEKIDDIEERAEILALGAGPSGQLRLALNGDEPRFNRGTPDEFVLDINPYTSFVYAELEAEDAAGEARVTWANEIYDQGANGSYYLAFHPERGVFLAGDAWAAGTPQDAVFGLHRVTESGALDGQTWFLGTGYQLAALTSTTDGAAVLARRVSATNASLRFPAGGATLDLDDGLVLAFADAAAAVTDVVRLATSDSYVNRAQLQSDGTGGVYVYLHVENGSVTVTGPSGSTALVAPAEVDDGSDAAALLARVGRNGSVAWARWFRVSDIAEAQLSSQAGHVALALKQWTTSTALVAAGMSGGPITLPSQGGGAFVFDAAGELTQHIPNVPSDCVAVGAEGGVVVAGRGPSSLPSGTSIIDGAVYAAYLEDGQDVFHRVLAESYARIDAVPACLVSPTSVSLALSSHGGWSLSALGAEPSHDFLGEDAVVLTLKR